MEKHYKVQSHGKGGWNDVGTWVRFYTDAESIALAMDKPKNDHIRILEKLVKNKYQSTYRAIFERGSVKRGVIREER